jgi:hypothetical protein
MVYATRLTSEGNTSLNWPENGSAVCAHFVDGTVNENRPSAIAYNLGLATTGDGNAILAWSDSRNRCGYDNDPCSNRTFAMRLLSDGPATSPTAAAATEAPMIDGASNPDGARAVASTDLALLGSRPLSGGGCEIRFSLATPEPARLDVFDLAGRRLLTRDLGAFGPGVHSTTVRSSELSRGVFFVRLAQGERRTNSRIVLTN